MKDKVAIVTGGTGALGRKISENLAENGAKVYVPSLSTEEFNKVFDRSDNSDKENFRLRKIYCFVCNAADEKSVIDFVNNVSVQEKGKIDYLINTVGGISPAANVIDTTNQELEKMIDINFRSAFYFSREVLKIMKKNNFGRIISVGAKAGLEITPGRFPYSFSKAGVISLMETISEEMKEYNIRCNTVIPAVIDTPANREWGSKEEIEKWIKPEEISEIILKMLSEEFSFLNGSRIKLFGSL
jgi:NAD(P)-dependent dehydrogenase (short-subunit alcohol dehydrogenase family)